MTCHLTDRWTAIFLAALLLMPLPFLFASCTTPSSRERFVEIAPAAVVPQATPAPYATWPWTNAQTERIISGIRRTSARQPDGTVLDLFQFDFRANPLLRLELIDQDQIDGRPNDDEVDFWPRSVAWLTANRGAGNHILFACNGPFFSVEERGGRKIGRHIAPVVLRVTPYYNVGNYRWAFGVKQTEAGPLFRAVHLPSTNVLSSELTYGACGMQCLIRDGKPLRLEPFPRVGQPAKRGPVPSTPSEAGHIPMVDHMKTSRISFGWSRDNRMLYVLCVTEPDNETQSALRLRHGETDPGGWTVADLQRFWMALGVWGAVNSDAGDVEQFAYRTRGGEYVVQPARWGAGSARVTVSRGQASVPLGGSLMYWVVTQQHDRASAAKPEL